MNARQDGRQGHWYDPTALAETENLSEPRPTYAYRKHDSNNASSVDATRPSANFFRGLKFALAFDAFLIAFVVAAAYLVAYIAVHVPTAVVILGGLVLVGLVVARGVRA